MKGGSLNILTFLLYVVDDMVHERFLRLTERPYKSKTTRTYMMAHTYESLLLL
jgi:hypothetical protein